MWRRNGGRDEVQVTVRVLGVLCPAEGALTSAVVAVVTSAVLLVVEAIEGIVRSVPIGISR